MKRFCARKDLPHFFFSDNGKTFKAASKVIHDIVSAEEVQQHLSQVNMKWSFNLVKAPRWGGMFERLIQFMKRCLRKVIGQAKLSYDELITTAAEIVSIINSRPLSYVTPDDLSKPLTPSHLLMGGRALILPDNLSYEGEMHDEDFELNPSELSKRVKYFNNALNQFWQQWRHKYLLELKEAHRFSNVGSSDSTVMADDMWWSMMKANLEVSGGWLRPRI